MIRKFPHWALAIFAACIAMFGSSMAWAEDNKENLIKAAFVYNFVKFIEWPDGKAIAKQSGIDICVLGDSAMASTGNVFKAASTPQLTLSLVREANSKAIASHCHIVFISKSEESRLDVLLSELKGKPVLTVSDIDGFAEAGGMIEFVLSDNKVRVEINKNAVTATGMRIDAQLLEIAYKVIDR